MNAERNLIAISPIYSITYDILLFCVVTNAVLNFNKFSSAYILFTFVGFKSLLFSLNGGCNSEIKVHKHFLVTCGVYHCEMFDR